MHKTSEIVVTDSPLLTTLVYLNRSWEGFEQLAISLHREFQPQINFLLGPCKNKSLYKTHLRLHSYEEAEKIYEIFLTRIKQHVRYDLELPAVVGNSLSEIGNECLKFILPCG